MQSAAINKKGKAYDNERNTEMDAADTGQYYQRGAHSTGRHIVHQLREGTYQRYEKVLTMQPVRKKPIRDNL